MQQHELSRRTFLHRTSVLAATGAFLKPSLLISTASSGTAKWQSVRLGGPVFNQTSDPEELALAHRKLGYRAAYCPNVALNDSARIKDLAAAFARHDVVLAEVGRWVNLMDRDAEKRKQNLQNVTDGLALAEAIGARCCVDIAGSLNPSSWFGPHKDNLSREHFDASVQNARVIIDAVKPKRAVFCYEVMGWAWPDTADHYLKMIKAIDRKGFGVHLDPCNMINCPEKFYYNTALLNEAFDKLGRYIASCHAKDLTWDVEMNVHFREVAPGKGALDYTTYLQRVAKLPQDPPVMLEHLNTLEEYNGAREYIFDTGRKAGLSF